MIETIRIFKANEQFDSVVMVELEQKNVTHVTERNNDVYLYSDDQLVGINIYNKDLQNKFTIGFNYPSEDNLNLINEYLNSNYAYDSNKYLRVGEVLSFEAVANSDKLNLCDVKVSDTTYKIVCGAANVEVGMKTIVALDNAILPTGVIIKAGKVLNTHSDGMLCSKKELGLVQNIDEKGIIKLSDDESLDNSYFEVDWRSYNV